MTRPCSISGCTDKHYARGWCLAHYRNNYRYGSPLGKDQPRDIPGLPPRPRTTYDGPENRIWRFTPDHWHRWLAKRNVRDEATERLARGVAEMRTLLERPPLRKAS